MDGVFEEQVRQRAYEIWVDLGRADGQAHEHWVAAERDLAAQPAKVKKARAVVAKSKTAAPKVIKATPAKVAPSKATKSKKVAREASSGAAA
ncbi:DUF2934 domain-containing protein [Beijerinckia sp. L45]|uniref:DUF2934 domain-containing protein n=1 Tax=Beijerinckia sp. L45 TaxID=1641855 RepID=UPI00131D2394|nr:DUF2934 domain-containing protein [Beijerinckia sp. L45]